MSFVRNVMLMWLLFTSHVTRVYVRHAASAALVVNDSSIRQCVQSPSDCGNLTDWITTSVTDMHELFHGVDIDYALVNVATWDTGAVTTMEGMFANFDKFNRDISKWNVHNVVNMRDIFRGATSFDQDLSAWDVSSVQTFQGAFARASQFKSDISMWDTSAVTSTANMFAHASRFDGDVSKWDTSGILDMSHMFLNASAYTGCIQVPSHIDCERAQCFDSSAAGHACDRQSASARTNVQFGAMSVVLAVCVCVTLPMASFLILFRDGQITRSNIEPQTQEQRIQEKTRREMFKLMPL